MLRLLSAQCCAYRTRHCLHAGTYPSAAMRGFSFFGGAFRAQELVAKNPCRVAALECLSDLLVFLAKIAVTALTFVAAFCLLAVCTRTHS